MLIVVGMVCWRVVITFGSFDGSRFGMACSRYRSLRSVLDSRLCAEMKNNFVFFEDVDLCEKKGKIICPKPIFILVPERENGLNTISIDHFSTYQVVGSNITKLLGIAGKGFDSKFDQD